MLWCEETSARMELRPRRATPWARWAGGRAGGQFQEAQTAMLLQSVTLKLTKSSSLINYVHDSCTDTRHILTGHQKLAFQPQHLASAGMQSLHKPYIILIHTLKQADEGSLTSLLQTTGTLMTGPQRNIPGFRDFLRGYNKSRALQF